jgi:NDP-sugar pyrophosphorylase family protein
MYKVLIASDGLGTRIGSLCNNINKSLISIANKPAISYIIEKIPKDIEIVIAIGYKKELLIQYLKIAHPDRKIVLVEVDKFEGEGSGLGYSILQCKDLLLCPFIFTSNDTIVMEDLADVTENWVGFSYGRNTDNYRTIRKKGDVVTALLEKRTIALDVVPYIGLAGIKDYEIFWQAMVDGQKYGSITEGESYGIKELIKQSEVKAKPFTWFDLGNIKGLNEVRHMFKDQNQYNILDKTDEAIWFVDDLVIKYSADKKFIANRHARAKKLVGFVPYITNITDNMYAYRKINGNVLSHNCNIVIFSKFLKLMQECFWTAPTSVDATKFYADCVDFYRNKTLNRISIYFNRFVDQQDQDEIINGLYIPNMKFILDKVNWEELFNGVPSVIHGDLHFENILLGEDGVFYLLDWRQDFAGNLDYFDIYYDLAKLYHGLIVSHTKVMHDEYQLSENENIINFDIPISFSLLECQHVLDVFIINNGYDLNKVKLLTAIVFLNNAPLHEDRYARFLFYLGKYLLWQLVSTKK